MIIDFNEFPKQFIICRSKLDNILSAKIQKIREYYIYLHDKLPVIDIIDELDVKIGIIIGWPFHKGTLLEDGSELQIIDFDWSFLSKMTGRFVCIIDHGERTVLQLDAAGLLPAVFSPDAECVASTGTLINAFFPTPRATDLEAIFDFPKRVGFLPFGLTAWQGVTRLLPNHELDLKSWKVIRIWPSPSSLQSAPVVEADCPEVTAAVADKVRRQCAGMFSRGQGQLRLSGGNDSRMVLAACRDFRERLSCVTLLNENQLDAHIAKKVAYLAGVNHTFIKSTKSYNIDDIESALKRSGYSVFRNVLSLKSDKEIHFLDQSNILVFGGTGADLARATLSSTEDIKHQETGPSVLLDRLRLPDNIRIRAAAVEWLSDLYGASRTTVLDLAKIEILYGCWDGPTVYADIGSTPGFYPFISRDVHSCIISIPMNFRRSGDFYRTFIGELWPELLSIPTNKATGFDVVRFPRAFLKHTLPRPIKRLIKPFR